MTVPLYLSRARLARNAPVQALAPLLLPAEPGARAGAAHRLVWSLFAGDNDARRDFLYREMDDGPQASFMILSQRAPGSAQGLFEIETKTFEPALETGDRLRFSLRANPTVARKDAGKGRGVRRDIIADALSGFSGEERGEKKTAIVRQAATAWLERQAARCGFTLVEPEASLRIDRDNWTSINRSGSRDIAFGTIDFDGELSVTDPSSFLTAVANGMGRAKAFGCGLMLIRRA